MEYKTSQRFKVVLFEIQLNIQNFAEIVEVDTRIKNVGQIIQALVKIFFGLVVFVPYITNDFFE